MGGVTELSKQSTYEFWMQTGHVDLDFLLLSLIGTCLVREVTASRRCFCRFDDRCMCLRRALRAVDGHGRSQADSAGCGGYTGVRVDFGVCCHGAAGDGRCFGFSDRVARFGRLGPGSEACLYLGGQLGGGYGAGASGLFSQTGARRDDLGRAS
jgi:hypothetical protein